MGGGGKGGGGSSQRPVTAQELRLWDAQKNNLDVITKITEDQYGLGKEDRAYYEKIFREGSDTQAKEALAKLQEKITGRAVSPETIKAVNIDSLLRDTILSATPEFKVAADVYIKNSNLLTDKYGSDVTGISDAFKTQLTSYTANYGKEVEESTKDYKNVLNTVSKQYGAELSNATNAYGNTTTEITNKFGTDIAKAQQDYTAKLQQLQGEYGTARQDVLSRETGQALGGLSTSFAESRKQMESNLARRGLAGSGIEANMLANTYQQEALAKAQAGTQARYNAIGQSDAIRQMELANAQQQLASAQSTAGMSLQAQQQAAQGIYSAGTNLAGQTYQSGTNLAQQGYQAGMQGSQNIYGANTNLAQQSYQSGLGAVQSIYGTVSQNTLQNYQLQNAATLQGISSLQQVAQAGQGLYAGSQNYLASAGSSAGNAAQIAGSSAANIAQANSQYATGMAQASATGSAGIGQLVGTLGSAGITAAFSDIRLKSNIKYVGNENGYNIYTWDWKEGYDYGYNKGVLAQEILELKPKAVRVMDNGYYAVDYSMLGLEDLVKGDSL